MGHAANETNCYVVIHGKKIRGSFKVIGDRVRYILGWKYRRNSIKEIPKKYCSFRKTYDTHVCIGQGDMDKKIWTYMMTIKN